MFNSILHFIIGVLWVHMLTEIFISIDRKKGD